MRLAVLLQHCDLVVVLVHVQSQGLLLPLFVGLVLRGLLHVLALGAAELLDLLRLVRQVVGHLLELGLLGILDGGLVGGVQVVDVGALVDERFAHFEVALPGCVVEWGLFGELVHVVDH